MYFNIVKFGINLLVTILLVPLSLTSKWKGTFQYYYLKKIFFNTRSPPPPPPEFFLHQIFVTPNFFLNVGNSMKHEENMKFWKKII